MSASAKPTLRPSHEILRQAIDGIPNAFLYLSARRPSEDQHGYTSGAEYLVTFVYRGDGVAVEWEPKYGPIQVWYEAQETDDGARPHHIFAFHNTPPGSWAQGAVEREGLPDALIHGNYEFLFDVLKSWARRGA